MGEQRLQEREAAIATTTPSTIAPDPAALPRRLLKSSGGGRAAMIGPHEPDAVARSGQLVSAVARRLRR